MDKYLFNLFRQFNEMQGIEYTNFNDPVYFENFCFWLIEQRKCGKIYQDFIQYLGFDIDNSDTVELRKGKYDSIALPNTTIVSPFASSLGKENKELFVFQGEPLIIGSNNFVSLFIKFVFFAISISPFHKHIVPNKVITKLIALSVDSNTELFISAK